MNYVECIGGLKSQRELAESVVNFCISNLMSRFKTLDISVNLNDISKDGAVGYCMAITSREFELEIHSKQTPQNLIKTICHEMVHVWQHATGKLYCDHWYNIDYTESEYKDRPWEIQAYNLEEPLQKKFIQSAKKSYFYEKNC